VNERREIHACRTCYDYGRVAVGVSEHECPECSSWDADKRADMLKQAVRDQADKPSISPADLTDDEKELLKEWTLCHPHVSQMTLLTWIEGRRYDPSKDQEFLAEARKRYRKWEFLRFSNVEGGIPSRIKHALQTGEKSHLSKPELEYLQSLRGGE